MTEITVDAFKGRHPLNLTTGEMIDALREAGHGYMTVRCGGTHEGAMVVVLADEQAALLERLLDRAYEAPHEEDILDAIDLLNKAIAEGNQDTETAAAE